MHVTVRPLAFQHVQTAIFLLLLFVMFLLGPGGGMNQVYVPGAIDGGGERAVLEARALGVDVEIEPDNPKLKELLESPIYDHVYYARQIRHGLELLAFVLGTA